MRLKKLIRGTLAVIAIIAICSYCFVRFYVLAPYDGEAVRIEIAHDATADDVKNKIKASLGDSFGNKVASLWALQGGTPSLAHGSFLVNKGDKAFRIARAIAKGRQNPVRLTFNNMRLITDLAGRIGQVLECDSASFMNSLDSILPAAGFRATQYSAAFLPNTYEFFWTAKPENIVNTLLSHRNNFWNEQRRAKAKTLGLTPVQVHALASIVEEETNRADERPIVARLYLNRLNDGMMLQADPTIKFAAKDFSLKRISGSLLKIDSPYNTYTHKGLPPGPIRIVEATTLDAVLDAPLHKYLYMCARSDFSGYHDFAESYATHRINAARYHRALNERGIK